MMKKNVKTNNNMIKPVTTFLGPPENIGKQTKEFKGEGGKKIISNLAGDPEKCHNVIMGNTLVAPPEKPDKVFKPCERLLKKLKRDQRNLFKV